MFITSDQFFSKMLTQPPAFFNTVPWMSVGPFLMVPGHQYQEAELACMVMQIALPNFRGRSLPQSLRFFTVSCPVFWEITIQCLGEAVPFSFFFFTMT